MALCFRIDYLPQHSDAKFYVETCVDLIDDDICKRNICAMMAPMLSYDNVLVLYYDNNDIAPMYYGNFMFNKSIVKAFKQARFYIEKLLLMDDISDDRRSELMRHNGFITRHFD